MFLLLYYCDILVLSPVHFTQLCCLSNINTNAVEICGEARTKGWTWGKLRKINYKNNEHMCSHTLLRLKFKWETEKMAQQFQELAALLEDPSSDPSSHVAKLKIICNPISRGSYALFWMSGLTCIKQYTCMYLTINSNKKNLHKNDTKCTLHYEWTIS